MAKDDTTTQPNDTTDTTTDGTTKTDPDQFKTKTDPLSTAVSAQYDKLLSQLEALGEKKGGDSTSEYAEIKQSIQKLESQFGSLLGVLKDAFKGTGSISDRTGTTGGDTTSTTGTDQLIVTTPTGDKGTTKPQRSFLRRVIG